MSEFLYALDRFGFTGGVEGVVVLDDFSIRKNIVKADDMSNIGMKTLCEL